MGSGSTNFQNSVLYPIKEGKAISKNKKEKFEVKGSVSDASDISDSRRIQPIVSIDEFFHDDPNIPWKPMPDHDLKQSPCYHIIGINYNHKISLYYCKLHPNIQNANLETIEHHCKYKDPNLHKSETLKLLSSKPKDNFSDKPKSKSGGDEVTGN